MSYREVWSIVRSLAHELVRRGVQPKSRIAIADRCSVEGFCALLAAWWLDAVPCIVSPMWSRGRISGALRVCQPRVCLGSSQSLMGGQPNWCDVGRFATARATRVSIAAQRHDADSYCYVLYTTGTTGEPRGVLGRHAGLWNYASYARDIHGDSGGSGVLQFAELCFVDSLESALYAFGTGSPLHFVDVTTYGSADHFINECSRLRVSHLFLPTAFVNRLGQSGAGKPSSLRVVSFGGSQVDPRALGVIGREWSGVRFLHGYGSTETYGVAAIGEVDPEREAMEANPSCGYPIPGLDFALLRQGTAAGELLLRGVGVAAGYVTRDGLTPLVPGPDAWFGTGDVFDHTSDGPLRFVGRMDRLCKVHGVRVSLEHVERVLESASGGAAAAYYDPKRDALVAVVERGDFGELRAAVRRRVGSASVPKFLVRVGSMPRTASGKIDYAAVNRADSVARLTSHRGGANT